MKEVVYVRRGLGASILVALRTSILCSLCGELGGGNNAPMNVGVLSRGRLHYEI